MAAEAMSTTTTLAAAPWLAIVSKRIARIPKKHMQFEQKR